MWFGYALSAIGLAATALLIYVSGPCGYGYDSPALLSFGDINVDLMNRSVIGGWAPMDYAAHANILIYNGIGPYFGSILGLDDQRGPTTDHRIIAPGIYFRWLGWGDGAYWLTLMVSLWWLIVASLAWPFVKAYRIRWLRFSLRFAIAAMSVVCVLCAFPSTVALLHPIFISLGLALALAARLGYLMFLGVSRPTGD